MMMTTLFSALFLSATPAEFADAAQPVLRPQIKVPIRPETLRTVNDKKAFVAQHLDLDMSQVGIRAPLSLNVAGGQMMVPNKAHIVAQGEMKLDPAASNWIIGPGALVTLHLRQAMLGGANFYLVIAEVEALADGELFQISSNGNIVAMEAQPLPRGGHQVAVVVRPMTREGRLEQATVSNSLLSLTGPLGNSPIGAVHPRGAARLTLAATKGWRLKRIDITPVTAP